MSTVPLSIGPLVADGYEIQRSGIRWLKDHGQNCRPGEMIAYCNIGLAQSGTRTNKPPPFAAEIPDLQVGFASKLGGRLLHATDSSHGGWFDYHAGYHNWRSDFTLGHVELDAEFEASLKLTEEPETLRLFVFAGRRTTPLADVRNGLICGWHSRSRVWSADGSGAFGTLLSLGICEQTGIIRGDQESFLEFAEDICGPAQLVYIPENPLVPSSCVLLEQMRRTPAQYQEIAADLAQSLRRLGPVPTPHDWFFLGSLLDGLQQESLREDYEVLTRSGLQQIGPANVVLLSLNAEASVVFRHKRLGYTVNVHNFRINEAGPAVRAMLKTEFRREKRTLEMIRNDLLELVTMVRKETAAQFFIMNSMSTSGYEDVFTYAPFDDPMSEILRTYHAKEANLMLHDLSRECGVSIVDADAIAADIGAERHLPDGIHQSGTLQREIREEILRLLAYRGVPGFSGTSFRVCPGTSGRITKFSQHEAD